MRIELIIFILLISITGKTQNRDPLKTEIITIDLENFWAAYESARPDFKPEAFQKLYLDKGTNGLKDFMDHRIKSAENLSKIISSHANYYNSIRKSSDSIDRKSVV